MGLITNLTECHVGKMETTHRGYTLGNGQIWLLVDKVLVLQRFLSLNSKIQVRQFPGLAGYYQQFIPACFSIAGPFIDLLKKDHPQK